MTFCPRVVQVEQWYGVTQTRQVYEKAIKELNEEGAREVRLRRRLIAGTMRGEGGGGLMSITTYPTYIFIVRGGDTEAMGDDSI